MSKNIYVIDGARTPYLKAQGKRGPFSAADLAVAASKDLLLRQAFAPADIGEVIVGCIMPKENEVNIARIISLRLGCGSRTPAWTVQRNCASGMQALDSAMKDILLGRYDLVLAGGTEAMSHAPLIWPAALTDGVDQMRNAKSIREKLLVLPQLRRGFLRRVIALLQGSTDPLVEWDMGQVAEILAYQFHITRQQMDEFALRSHQRLAAAQDAQHLSEIIPLYDHDGRCYTEDTSLRRDTSLEKLVTLSPFFNRPFGAVTAGNSLQVADGAAMLILASEAAVERYQLPALGRIVDIEWAALSPEVMGLGPVLAATSLLQRQQLALQDIDYWEINEAFAAQVLACIAAWESESFCREHLGLPGAFGTLDQQRLNVDGGAIALGHPIGSSGAGIVLHLFHVLQRNHAKRGIAAICIGGGQGGAVLLEAA